MNRNYPHSLDIIIENAMAYVDRAMPDNPPVFIVTPCTFYGRTGWAFDGFAGETPREAVHEAALNGSKAVNTDDAFGPALFVDATTNLVIPEA